MIIYVRTQDKTKMFEISAVNYQEKRKTKRVMYEDAVTSEIIESRHILSDGNKDLGEYATKERCFEIMTEIQNAIAIHGANDTIVYNMPEA